MKTVLTGCLQRSGTPKSAAGLGGFVTMHNWAALEPTKGQYNFAAIDTALAAGTKLGLRAKLRILAGGNAQSPPWLLQECGVVKGYSHMGTVYNDVPMAWKPPYTAAYARLQQALANRYDADPRMAVFVDTGPMSVYAEPFLFWNNTNEALLLKSGCTEQAWVAADDACIQAHAVDKQTPSALSYNPWQGPGKLAVTLAGMDTLRRVLGPSATLENNSWRDTSRWGGTDPYDVMYGEMAKRGGPICLQTATIARVGNLRAAMQEACKHATSIELPSGHDLTVAEMDAYNALMAKNAPAPFVERRKATSPRRVKADRRSASHRVGAADRRKP